VLQVIEDLFDHHWVFDAGDNLDSAAAFPAGLDVDIEDPLQTLRPAHRGAAFGRDSLLLPLPRFAGVTDARCLLFGANTPWNLESWRQVFSEDIFVVEGMQKARYSPAFTGGVFSAVMDVPSHHFHQWVAEKYGAKSDEGG
jgi:hypothetical protein